MEFMEINNILLGHGSGGTLSHALITELFLQYFDDHELLQLDDAARLDFSAKNVIFSTDSYVVDPIFFPGGDIGKLAVCGTVNDLAMLGARPLFLSVGFILEEGFPVAQLELILKSMKNSAEEAQVRIVTGDTKVVPHGAVDKIFINTSGIGEPISGTQVSGHNAKIGDVVIINGPIAQHGIAVMASREGLKLELNIETDVAPLNHLVTQILEKVPEIHTLRDPTRGGIATTLNEIAYQSQIAIKIVEQALPILPQVQSACEILGLDPLYIANEGKCMVFCPAAKADHVLSIMQKHKYGQDACIIGEVIGEPPSKVFMQTAIGGQRIIDMLAGEQLPRIC
jgi:hydrogenase expression/formation protein HypE